MTRPRRRIRLDNDQRRSQLLALARKAFSDRAYDDVSIDDLAREAKISKGLLYHYFPTKRDLYVAGLSEIAAELVQRVTSAPDELPPSASPTNVGRAAPPEAARSPIESVRAGLDAYLAHVHEHSRAFVSLMRGGIGSDPEVAGVIESVRSRLFDQFLASSPFDQAIARDPKLRIGIRGWMGFVEAASIDWCSNPRLSRVELRELLAQILFETLRVIAPSLVR